MFTQVIKQARTIECYLSISRRIWSCFQTVILFRLSVLLSLQCLNKETWMFFIEMTFCVCDRLLRWYTKQARTIDCYQSISQRIWSCFKTVILFRLSVLSSLQRLNKETWTFFIETTFCVCDRLLRLYTKQARTIDCYQSISLSTGCILHVHVVASTFLTVCYI